MGGRNVSQWGELHKSIHDQPCKQPLTKSVLNESVLAGSRQTCPSALCALEGRTEIWLHISWILLLGMNCPWRMEKLRLLLWGIIGPLWRGYEKLSARLSSVQRIDYNLSELLSFSEFNFDFFKMEIETHL